MTAVAQDTTIGWELKKDPFLSSLRRSLLLFWVAFRFSVFATFAVTILVALWIAKPLYCTSVFFTFWLIFMCLFLVLGILAWFIPEHVSLNREGIKYTGSRERIYCWKDIEKATVETAGEDKNVITFIWQGRTQQRRIPISSDIDLEHVRLVIAKNCL